MEKLSHGKVPCGGNFTYEFNRISECHRLFDAALFTKWVPCDTLWTVDSLLDLLSGDALALQPEPLSESEAEGIDLLHSEA